MKNCINENKKILNEYRTLKQKLDQARINIDGWDDSKSKVMSDYDVYINELVVSREKLGKSMSAYRTAMNQKDSDEEINTKKIDLDQNMDAVKGLLDNDKKKKIEFKKTMSFLIKNKKAHKTKLDEANPSSP